jgi:hypothetical protein
MTYKTTNIDMIVAASGRQEMRTEFLGGIVTSSGFCMTNKESARQI